MSFTGRAAVVTGAGSGIGRAVAVELASRGAHLAISDIDPLSLAHTADLVARAGTPVHTATVDVADRAAVDAYAAEVLDYYESVHVLVNNAGIAGDTGPFVEADIDRFEAILGVNLWGVINGTRAFLPALIASGNGHLVNISSINGVVAQPGGGAYCTSKFAVRGFSESVSADLLAAGAPVRVTVVHPGGVSTNIASASLERARAENVEVTSRQQRRVETYNAKLLRMDPAKAARIIVDGVAAGRPRVLVGNDARLLDLLARLAPGRIPAIAAWSERRVFGAPTTQATGSSVDRGGVS